MKGYGDSLRGYGHETHMRYNFRCQYCGYDGKAFPNWLNLTIDHIIPLDQGGPDEEENYITVCHLCNSFTSQMEFPKGMTKKHIIAKKRERVLERRQEYFRFWLENVAPLYLEKEGPEKTEGEEPHI